jgi:uncharacterized membrane protein
MSSAAAQVALPEEGRAAGLVLGAAVLAMGLIAGLFYAYACSVMPGLGRASDKTALEAMKEINDAILNPVFLLTFLGAPVAAGAALVLERHAGSGDVARWIVAGLVLHAVAFLVTMAANVPLNDDLARADLSASAAQLAALRDHFEGPWVAWNVVRTVASVVAFGCLTRALLLHASAAPSTLAG